MAIDGRTARAMNYRPVINHTMNNHTMINSTMINSDRSGPRWITYMKITVDPSRALAQPLDPQEVITVRWQQAGEFMIITAARRQRPAGQPLPVGDPGVVLLSGKVQKCRDPVGFHASPLAAHSNLHR